MKTLPQDVAFSKLYLANMLSYNDADKKYASFYQVSQESPMMAELINKLTPSEVSFLVDRIEATK